MSDTVPFHFGFATADLDGATATQAGVQRWLCSAWRSTRYFDAGAGGVVEVRSRVAYGRLSPDIALEFLQVDRCGPVPSVWQLEGATSGHDGAGPSGIGVGHIGHWVQQARPVAQRLLRAGGRIVMARANSPGVEALDPALAGDPDAVPEELDTCYVLTVAGQLVELVPARIWAGRLLDTFGPDVPDVIPKPPSRMLAPTR